MRWQDIKDDKEKYNAYLCSREWAEKRDAVRERAHGVCERCRAFSMDACHHLTYARKYNEPLEDLQGICNPCHEFTHHKDDFDPKAHRYFIRYVSHVASDKTKRPVGYEFLMGLDPEIHSYAAQSAVMLLYQQSLFASAVTYSHATAGEFSTEAGEECQQADQWIECAELIQSNKLGIDLIGWLKMNQPQCEDHRHYWLILERYGFGPLNAGKE